MLFLSFRIQIKLIVVIIFFAFLLGACRQNNTDPEQFLDHAVRRHSRSITGMSIAVFNKDDLLLKKSYGYANITEKLPVDSNTVFDWGSISKLLVWISIRQLAEKNELDLNTDIRSYINDDLLTELRYPITVLHLMNHSAGWLDSDLSRRPSELLDVNAMTMYGYYGLRDWEIFQSHQPGDFYSFSDLGIILASYIVEKVSNMPFHIYVHNHIFKPLGMAHTALLPNLSDNPWVKAERKKLIGYISADGKVAERNQSPRLVPFMASGTISDLRRFAQALIPNDDGASILFERAETLSELHFFLPLEGYAFRDSLQNFIGLHGMTGGGCTSSVLIDLNRGIGVAVMTNLYDEAHFNQIRLQRGLISRFD